MMKGVAPVKTILIVVIMLLVGVLGVLGVNAAKTFMAGASADVEPKNVVGKPDEEGKTATVSWTSDKPSVGVVEYGATPASLLLRAPESEATTTHKVILSPLKSGTNYYFRVRVGEEVFDNNGIPYSFKTKAATEVVSKVTPTTAPAPASTSCDRLTDYNGDGVVNTLDIMTCVKKNGAGGTIPLASGSGVLKQSCEGVDFDNNGVVNSLDRIKCLQSKR